MTQEGSVLQCQAELTKKISFKPSNVLSKAHRTLTLAVRKRAVRGSRIKKYAETIDPEQVQYTYNMTGIDYNYQIIITVIINKSIFVYSFFFSPLFRFSVYGCSRFRFSFFGFRFSFFGFRFRFSVLVFRFFVSLCFFLFCNSFFTFCVFCFLSRFFSRFCDSFLFVIKLFTDISCDIRNCFGMLCCCCCSHII